MISMYLVDTSAWIDFLRKKDDRLIPYLEGREVYICDVVLFELLSGVPHGKQRILRDSLSLFGRLPMTEEAALLSAGIAADMRLKGAPPQTTDMLIAGTAIVSHAVLIHKDSDFEMIKRFSALRTISFL